MTPFLEMWRRRVALLAVAGLFAIGNLALFWGYRSSTQTRRAALEARRDELRRTVEASEAEATRLAGQRERLSGVSSAIEEFYGRRIGPERETLAPVVAEVHAILKDTGVAAQQISYATTQAPKLPLLQMRIAFTVQCDYARFKRLLHAFESSHRWIVVRDVSISRDADRPGSVQVQMEAVTYFSEPAGAPVTESKPAKAGAARKAPAVARKAG